MASVKNNEPIEFKITGSWDRQARQLKKKFCQLTNADMKLESGKDEELIDRMGARLNKNRQEIINLIKNCQPF